MLLPRVCICSVIVAVSSDIFDLSQDFMILALKLCTSDFPLALEIFNGAWLRNKKRKFRN